MPTLKLTDLASCKAYFTTIATLHKEVDSFKWGEKDLVKKSNRSDIGEKILWAKPYDGADYQNDASDNIIKNKVLELRYMVPISANAAQDLKEAAATATEAVIEQILAKMLVDKRGVFTEGVLEMIVFRIAGMKTENFEMTIGSTNYIGCELKLTFQDNTKLAYDASKWNEPEPEP
jgi:hypothetical protein